MKGRRNDRFREKLEGKQKCFANPDFIFPVGGSRSSFPPAFELKEVSYSVEGVSDCFLRVCFHWQRGGGDGCQTERVSKHRFSLPLPIHMHIPFLFCCCSTEVSQVPPPPPLLSPPNIRMLSDKLCTTPFSYLPFLSPPLPFICIRTLFRQWNP